MAVVYLQNLVPVSPKSSNSAVNDADISRLQEEISKHTEKSAGLLQEVHGKLVWLWKENVGYKMLVEKFQKDISQLEDRINALTKKRGRNIYETCQEFNQENEFYFKKCKLAEGQVVELGTKLVEKEKLLSALRKEVSQLQTLFHLGKENVKHVELGDSSDVGTDSADVSELSKGYHKKLRDHARPDSGEGPFECPVQSCGKKFCVKYNFNRHMNTHTREVLFECSHEGCGKKFTESGKLKQHSYTHVTEKPFTCTVERCGKSFTWKGLLRAHLRTHVGEKPYLCTVNGCGRRFIRVADLREHGYVHGGKRKMQCTVDGCDVSFSSSSKMKIHMLTHTGEKPYVCTVEGCGKSFSRNKSLRDHNLLHTGDTPFPCPLEGCGERFTGVRSLRQHILMHTGERPHECGFPGCGRRFIHKEGMRKHMEKHEGKWSQEPDLCSLLENDGCGLDAVNC